MINKVKEKFRPEQLMKGNFGIEREGLRCDRNGRLVTTPHPEVFGNKLKNPYITTDFSESQLEFITPVFNNIDDTYTFLENLYDVTMSELGSELIWPQSMPCNVPSDNNIPIAQFCNNEQGKEASNYRKHLLSKYGGKKQLLSGIHYNFSFDEKLLEFLYKQSKSPHTYQGFKSQTYLRVARNYLRYRWLIIYLLGSTSVVHTSYDMTGVPTLDKFGKDGFSCDGALSFRNSKAGYVNRVELYPNYSNIDNYINSLIKFVRDGLIESPKELYTQVRIKAYDNNNFLASLKQDGVNYLEYRSIDINPFDRAGLAKNDIYFMHLFNLFLLFKEETINMKWQQEALANQYHVAMNGLYDISLMRDGQQVKKADWAMELLNEVMEFNNFLQLGQNDIVQGMMDKVKDASLTYAHKMLMQVEQLGYIEANIRLARKYKKQVYDTRYLLSGYEDLELSTQQIIKESIKRGVAFEVVDRKENFIKLKRDGNVQYVKQATKTGKDSYITTLIMENKTVTKKVLKENGIKVPKGNDFDTIDNAKEVISRLVDKPVVIKPKTTNYGLGISIFPAGATQDDLFAAVDVAFSHDKSILVEEFIAGREYRFLVIGDEVVAILRRIPANVIGDGMLSITKLVEEKNNDPLRGKGHKTPLEKIKLGKIEELCLKQSGYDFDYVPEVGELVYLRENSNISTGGDSVDFTDKAADYFKYIAVKAAKSVGASICGVDLMVRDITSDRSAYAIIELNFNPAIHMHCYPYKGIERNIAAKVLDLLGYPVIGC
ncbi:MAG: glutathione synthetase [Epulopiscium sp. Nele67-Bin002]|nr:MAG: glutathione synthetase [Epulopiscium sp. Nele67-Bin002]